MRVLIKTWEAVNLDNVIRYEFTAQSNSGKIIKVEDNIFGFPSFSLYFFGVISALQHLVLAFSKYVPLMGCI